jgi:hypothetical protein
MESQQQLKWRNVLRDEVRETRTKDGRQTDRCYYLVIYSHLELDHAVTGKFQTPLFSAVTATSQEKKEL